MKYNYINDEIKIDFPVTRDIRLAMEECERLDQDDNIGGYCAYVEFFLYTLCKEAIYQNHLTHKQWETLQRRYVL